MTTFTRKYLGDFAGDVENTALQVIGSDAAGNSDSVICQSMNMILSEK
jgi:hypothetical protein